MLGEGEVTLLQAGAAPPPERETHATLFHRTVESGREEF